MIDDDEIAVAALCGSLRRDSYNMLLLEAAAGLAPPGMTFELVEIGALPLYDDDQRRDGYPPAVEHFRTRLALADAILFVTPEYNYSVPGPLKNAIDWASRPPGQPFEGKPVGIMGASVGRFGTSRAQYHLRQILVFLDAHPLNRPEVMIAEAQSRFDAAGNLVDPATRDLVRAHLEALAEWTQRLQRSKA